VTWIRIFTTLLMVCTAGSATFSADPDFVRDVLPILRRHCDRCHGAANQEASLSFTVREGFTESADSGLPIVVPGKPDESLLLARITDPNEGDLMPLDGDPLSENEVNTIRGWIAAGGNLPDENFFGNHWAYEAPRVSPSTLRHAADSGLAPIDFFIHRKLEQVGLQPAAVADPATLARRVSLALTGLPANLQQIDALVADPSDENYERLVDELLASEAFGVHWARHWLDLARYADSNGFQADQLRDSWAYRDWVVDAFNQDKPFDQFVIEQLAGDLLPNATTETRIATGFHRTPTCNVEAGVHPEANRVQQVFDRVDTTGTVFLGTTMECAQCHDHKYDPFTQEDYYRLFAYFNNTPLEVEQASGVRYDFVGPKMELSPTRSQQLRRDDLQTQIDALQSERDQLLAEMDFGRWRQRMTAALKRGRPRWTTPSFTFSTTGNEDFSLLDDNSVLLSGDFADKTLYRFAFDSIDQPISAIRIDALRHDALPGKGPGRGDNERTNFVLHEVELAIESKQSSKPLQLGNSKASFSQSRYNVANAVDGDPKTGWAIAPEFEQEHWATFDLRQPQQLTSDQQLVVTLDQHFGRGRVIGRPKISLLVGPPETAGLTAEIIDLLSQDSTLSAKQVGRLKTFFQSTNPAIKRLESKINSLEKQIKQIEPPTTLVMVEREQPRDTFVMKRGDYLSPGKQVAPGTPQTLHPLAPDLPPNRLGLAQWLVDPANPLLARVTVNRFWAEIFGRGIVATPEDFGTQSDPPSHPKLLDWLAIEFQRNQWSVKSVLKSIVMSQAFRQDSAIDAKKLETDPDNALLSRGPRFRLPAETIRDNALAVSGLLCRDCGGPPIMPYQPDGIWRAVGRNQPKWNAATDRSRYRRGLYVVWKRGAPYPSFVSFDAPDRASCTVGRPRTNTPLQALVLMNDLTYAEASVGLAARMLRESESHQPQSIANYGFRLATGQDASPETKRALATLYERQWQRLSDHPDEIEQRLDVLPKTFHDLYSDLNRRDLAAWYSVANVLLNLDQTITVN
jgi:hypothetical protein